MERDVMDIVKEKEFIELTASDRAELGELCSSEEEYNQVKSMFVGMSAMDWSNPTPKAETKESLDALFAQSYPKAAPVWYNAPLAVLAPKGKPFYRQPLVQAAAVGLLLFLAYPFVNSTVMDSKTNQVALLEKKELGSESNKSKEITQESSEESTNEIVLDDQESSTVENQQDELPVSTLPKPVPSVSSGTINASLTAVAAETPTPVVVTERIDDALAFGDTNGAAKPGSTHPDGIFIGEKAEIFSVPASSEPAVFDLLTSTF